MSKKLELAMRIRTDLNQARGDLKALGGDVEDLGDKSEKTSRDMERIGSTLGKIAGAVAGGVLYKAVISATIEQERVTAQLEQRLRSTQGAAGLTRDELLDMASAMQQVTTYGDEAVIPAQSLLLTFTEIGREVFPKALETVLDMSVAMDQDLKASAIQLGKALNDPVQGITALSRVGVQFTEDQKEMIKQLQETGRTADAQRIILGELETQMGGSARAARDTFGGSIEALKNSFGDLLEGDASSPGLKDAREAIEDLTNLLSDPATKESFGIIIGAVAQLTTVAAEATVALGDLTQNLGAMFQNAFGDLDPLKALNVEIRAIDRAIKGGLDTPAKYLFTSDGELKSLKAQLVAERDLILETRKGAPASTTSNAPSSVPTAPEAPVLNADAQKLLDTLTKQAAMIGLVTEEAKVRYAIESGELGKLLPEQQELLLTQARQLDQFKASSSAADEQRKSTEKLTSSQVSYVQNLERQAALIGLNTNQTRDAEFAEKGLTGALRERAKAAAALLAAEEERLAVNSDAASLAGLQAQSLRAQGKEAEALEIKIQQRYGELMTRLKERGNAAGLDIVNGLINMEQARARLTETQAMIDQMFDATGRQEQTVQAQLETGLITEGEARRRIVELHKQQATEVEKLLPLMQELAVATGDPAALENVERIRAELESMQVISNELAISFRDGLQGGLEEAIMGLAEGTMTLRDALDSLVLGIAESMAKMASEGLAELATQGVMDLFAQGAQAAIAAAGQKAAAEVAAIGTVTAAKTAADTTMAASSVASANAAAAGQATAAATTTTAWAPAATTASIGSFGAAAAIGLAAVVAALAMSQSFNTGGKVRGEGTGTSDSIRAWLSNGEFVTRAAVMSQPGAEAFAEDFNQRGMVALEDWTGAARQATGGLAGVPAPAAPAPAMNNGRLADPTAVKQNTTLKNAVNLYAVQNPADIASMAWGREGEEHFEVYLQKNGARVRQLMGIN